MTTLTGTANRDTLTGGAGNDSIYGLGGNDRILSGDGEDYIEGGDGNDEINGYLTVTGVSYFAVTGRKTIKGGAGNDVVFGGSGNDTLYGDDGNDRLDGMEGQDSLLGGTGNDTLYGDDGNDTLWGEAGNDYLEGGAGDDSLDGGDGNDELYSQEAGRDTLMGGAGNDRLDAFTGTGSKWLDGGLGQDTLYGGINADTLIGGAGQDYLYGYEGNDSLSGDDGNDRLYGGDGNNTLTGGDGNDVLYGGDGSDTLDGGAGVDELRGGAGNDTYFVRNSTQVISDDGGVDQAIVSASFVKLPSSVESVTFVDGALALPYWVDALLPDEAAGLRFQALLAAGPVMFYAFPTSLPAYEDSASNAKGWAPLSTTQRARALEAFRYIESVVDLHFQASTNPDAPNTITLANNDQTGSAGYAYYPSTTSRGSDVFLDNSSAPSNVALADGTYGALTLIHELGHALGLEHPFSASGATGGSADPPNLTGAEDSTRWSVMSYNDAPTEYYLRYSPLDIAALQYLYGPSKTARTANDTYTVSELAPNFIWDGAGTDTLSAASCTQGCTLYLTPGYWGYVGTGKSNQITANGQVTVNFGSVIENLTGSTFADRLYGNDSANLILGGAGNDLIEGGAGADTLQGGTGNDTLTGGTGTDEARFSGVRAQSQVTRGADGSLTVVGADGTDVLTAVERLVFSDSALAYDVDGPGGQTYRLYKAAFDRTPDPGGVGFWMYYLDRGFDALAAATNFMNSQEFRNLYDNDPNLAGYQEPTAERFVTLLYQHVLQRAAEGAGYQFWVDAMNNKGGAFGRAYSRAEVLVAFAESSENKTNLVGVITSGFAYTPYDPGTT